MNKYQEALNTIMCETCHIGQVGKPIQVIKELVDKETPIKPIQRGKDEFLCGKCKFTVADNDRNFLLTRCGNVDCGQVVDWGSDYEYCKGGQINE